MKQLHFSSTSKFLITLLLFLSFAITLALVTFSVFLLVNNYDNFCHLLLSKLGKSDKERFFKESFLQKEKYQIIQIIVVIASFITLFANFLLLKRREAAREKLTPLLVKINLIVCDQVTFLKTLKHLKFFFFALLFVQFSFFTWCAITFPISYDEAWTYLNFTNKSVLASVSYYPAPNNHVLFSILTNITNIVPFSDPKIKMRMINILFSLISTFVFFKFLCKFYSTQISLFIVTAFAFTYPVALYSMQARGYGMLILFSLISIYSTISYLQAPSKKQFTIYLLSIIAGFYTIPTFLYPFISLQLFIGWFCITNKKTYELKKFLVANCIGGCIVLILYAPIIFISGLKAITNNAYVKSISLTQVIHDLPEHFTYSFNWLFGLNSGGTLLVGLIAIALFLTLVGKQKQRGLKIAGLCMFIFIFAPPFILILQRVVPFERTWTYLTIPFFFGLAAILMLISAYFKNISVQNKFMFPAILVFTAAVLTAYFPKNYKSKHPIDYQADELFTVDNIRTIHSVTSNEILLTDMLTYKISVLNNNTSPKITGIDTTAKVNTDALILDNNFIAPVKNLNEYTFIGKNDYIQLYLKKTIAN